MGWLRWVGSFKLQVSFAEHSLFYRALLQMRPVIWRSLLIVASPESCRVWRCVGFRRLFEVCYHRRVRQSVWYAHDYECDNVCDMCVTKWVTTCMTYTWQSVWHTYGNVCDIHITMRDISHRRQQIWRKSCYGVATVSRSLLQNTVSFIGLFCKRDL